MAGRSLFSELRERKVVQAAAIYGAVAWGVTEVVVTIVEQLFLPQWVSTLAVIFFVVGFPVAMFLAWTFDLTREGIRRTAVSSGRGTASIAISMILLLAGTAGLFFLIKPGMDSNAPSGDVAAVLPNSIAVLPFDYSGPNPDESYLGPGLSDELRGQIGRVDGLRVAARLSSMAVVREGGDARMIANRLGVALLLEGSMRRHGNSLRVSAQLIDGTTGLAVWNQAFDRDRRELLNIQQDIAEAVVRVVLPGSSHPVTEPATLNATAHELMLLGSENEKQVREREDVDIETLQRAVRYYRQATEADPESALAHARLAGALVVLGDVDAAGVSANRALELDPKLAEAHHAYGNYLWARGRPNMGESLARAVELNPNLPDALNDYAFWYWFNVGTKGVPELYQRALDLDPLNVERFAALGHFLAINDRPDEARALIEHMRVTFDGATAYRAIAHLFDLVGDVDHAIAWTIKARDSEPDDPLHVEQLAEYYTDIGEYETVETLTPDIGVGMLWKMRRYDETIEKAEELYWDRPDDIQMRVYLAFAYNVKGRFEDAIRMIETSGLIESYAHTRRSGWQQDGFGVLLDAAYSSGEIEWAREQAEWELATHYEADTSDWWVALENACSLAILGRDDDVYRLFRRTQESNHLAWEPMLRDHLCFERFADDPAYLAVVRHFDDRRAMLRERLPKTLARYGVSL